MSTSFNFPANPTLNQIVTLPDGNQAQWNGSAWVSVTNNVTYPLPVASGGTGATNPLTAKRNLAIPIWTLDDAAPAAPVFGDRWIRPGSMTEVVWLPNANPGGGGVWVNLADAGSVAYPIPVSKGGTGATTAAGARTNLGIDPLIAALLPLDGSRAMTGALLHADGTVAAPSINFASEPGLGWYRPGAGARRFAVGGLATEVLDSSAPTSTGLILLPRAQGIANILLRNQAVGSVNYNQLILQQNSDGSALVQTAAVGTATRGNLTLDAPNVTFTGSAIISNSGQNCLLILNKTVNGVGNILQGSTNSAARWSIYLGNTTTEAGANGGSDFSISRFNDSGAYLGDAIFINRSSGNAVFPSRLSSSFGLGCRWGNAGPDAGNTFNVVYDGTSAARVYIDSTWTTVANPSDERLKTGIEDLSMTDEAFLAIRPISFYWADGSLKDSSQSQYGFSAQNMAAVAPQAGAVSGSEETMYGLDAMPILAMAVNRIQSLIARLAALEAA